MMANFSSLFFLALLGLGAFGSSYATPYIPRQGSNHIQVVEPSQQQQQEDVMLAVPLPSSGLPQSQGQSSGIAQGPSPVPSSELQQSPPRVTPDAPPADVEPMDQEVGTAEFIVETLTEAERTNLVSYLICEMCKELEVSMCIRMCNGESGNGTQIEAVGNNSTEQEEDGSIATILGDSEDGEGNNGTAASADGGNSTAAAEGTLDGNATQSNAEGSEEDGSLFNLGGDASGQAGNSSSSSSSLDGNATVSAEEQSNNNATESEAASEEFGQSENSTALAGGEEGQSGNSTETLAEEGTEDEGGRSMSRRSLGGDAGNSTEAEGEDGSIFNVLGEEEDGQFGNSSLSGGNGTANSTHGNGTEASNWW